MILAAIANPLPSERPSIYVFVRIESDAKAFPICFLPFEVKKVEE
jgi:hypothetical protein